MGYAIQYGPKTPYSGKRHRAGISARLVTAAVILAFALCVRFAFPSAVGRVRSVLLPGFGEEAAEALAVMAQQIGAGEPVDSAVSAFCQEIMENAQVSITP